MLVHFVPVSEITPCGHSFHSSVQVSSDAATQTSELHIKLDVARQLACRDRFYIPHNIDFRCVMAELGEVRPG